AQAAHPSGGNEATSVQSRAGMSVRRPAAPIGWCPRRSVCGAAVSSRGAMPLPYPHRATFLASTLIVPLEHAGATPFIARMLSLIVFDHFLRHPVVTLGDDDERYGDEQGRMLD